MEAVLAIVIFGGGFLFVRWIAADVQRANGTESDDSALTDGLGEGIGKAIAHAIAHDDDDCDWD